MTPSFQQSTTAPRGWPALQRRFARLLAVVVGGALLATTLGASAGVPLADMPLFSSNAVPGNVAFALSVEYPTAVRAAYPDTNSYLTTSTYYGYFDPDKCYAYNYVATEPTSPAAASDLSHFYPNGKATAHVCSGLWSGNYLNWATTQTIDPFRQVLTGGYRVLDTITETVLQKATQSGQGSLFPDKSLTGTTAVGGATPGMAASLGSRVMSNSGGIGIGFRFTTVAAGAGLTGDYFATSDLSGGVVLSKSGDVVDYNWGGASPGKDSTNKAIPSAFSARWSGTVAAPVGGSYKFQTISDKGVRLWVNDVLVIDSWVTHAARTDTSTSDTVVVTGATIKIKLEYYTTGTSSSQMRLLWSPPGYSGSYATFLGGLNASAALPYTSAGTVLSNVTYDAKVRAKVCDPSILAGGLESNCKVYGLNAKPEGLIQQYAKKMRFSAFGYLNDSNDKRDGGVLRARQKFVGPMQPVPNDVDVTNTVAEWDNNGVFVVNPDTADVTSTNTNFGVTVSNSGVINYLNKFGQLKGGNYKTNDPVGELYYASLRYFKNLGNVPAWYDMTGASATTKSTYIDGFPVIKDWDDPIQYSCQKNFVLGIGDVRTHSDRNLPGAATTSYEPPLPTEVSNDTTVNASTATDKIGTIEGMGTLSGLSNINGCCGGNSYLMAGLAYDANVQDIRPDDARAANTIGKQTVQTYWVDVLEQGFVTNNQFYLAAKYGGFVVPKGYDYASTAKLPLSSWSTSGDILGSGTGAEPRPDSYYTAGRPDTMISGLTKAFASIASQLKTTTTSFSAALPQVATSGNASYSATFDGENSAWTGELVASSLSFASDGTPTTSQQWKATDKLAAQLAGTGWDSGRRVITWNAGGVPFRAASLSSAQSLALDTAYRLGNDSADFLNYVRGDRSQEQASTVAGSSKAYRTRTLLMGDIAGSKAVPVGPPSLPLADVFNPGYASFKSSYGSRPTFVYVGANDGMLHAFDGSLTGSTAGKEVFAYVPSGVISGPGITPSTDGLAAVGNPTFDHHFYVNATPAYFDVDLGRTYNGSAVGTSTNWKSLLIGGLGKGGRSYYAIDVTDPTTMGGETETQLAARLKWEFTDAKMGFSYGEPLMVKTRKYGWTLVLTSGYGNADGVGYVFFVNPSTGALLERVSTGEGTVANEAGLAQVNAYTIDFTDGTVDAVYGGDLLGNLWRFDVSGTSGSYPSPVKIASLVNAAGQAQPVTSPPRIELHPKTKKRMVLVGTGRQLAQSDLASSQEQSFYAIADGDAVSFNKAALPSGVSYPLLRRNLSASTTKDGITDNPTTTLGWYMDLGKSGTVAWRVISKPDTFFGTVAFAPTASILTDVCNPSGKSRIYGIDFSSGKSKILVDGASAAYWDKTDGVVTDLKFFSVNGTVRLIGGSNKGAVDNVTGEFGNLVNVRRLNWRELPMAN